MTEDVLGGDGKENDKGTANNISDVYLIKHLSFDVFFPMLLYTLNKIWEGGQY